ncbi:13294_t:CDS:2 [Entrophospora sp. SA101]|nr:13294_t:CDS:2 [Entrophospora sp. SA101]
MDVRRDTLKSLANPIPFDPISTDPPPPIFPTQEHTQPPFNIDTSSTSKPIETNKWYVNMMLDKGQNPIWPLPYGLRWENNQPGQTDGFFADPVQYYYSVYTPSIIVSANELTGDNQLILSDMTQFSTNIYLYPTKTNADPSSPSLNFPVTRGMSFTTVNYKQLSPVFYSGIGFKTIDQQPQQLPTGWIKYNVVLENDITWLIYINNAKATLVQLSQQKLELTLNGNGNNLFDGIIQITKVPKGDDGQAESLYDQQHSTYSLNWKVGGNNTIQPLIFALPHHQESFDNSLSGLSPTKLIMTSPAQGELLAYVGNVWQLKEPEFSGTEFLPTDWESKLSDANRQVILDQAKIDLALDFDTETTSNSTYFSGKSLAKFAALCLVISDVLKDPTLFNECFDKLKKTMDTYLNNQQQTKLVYETTWKGLVSNAGFTSQNPIEDFGNTWYNDHHYHYGYYLYTSAIISHFDEAWGRQNQAWVNTLLRDVVNPSPLDTFFPTYRSFDWYAGHSWSKGIFPSADGKDEESTSEELNFYYSMKLWAITIKNDQSLKLSNLIISILRRSLRNYFLLEDDNKNHPPNFIKNKVTGILFENKADYTTYFCPRTECIHGIQMLPMTPMLPFVRSKIFVTQEWQQKLATIVDGITDSWKSILYMNYAIINPVDAFQFFQNNPSTPLDDGLTRTWALFWSSVQ